MIDIEKLKEIYENDEIYVTVHVSEKIRVRSIKMRDIRSAVMNGEIIEQYPEDFPYPSCLILGYTLSGEPLHIVMSYEGSRSSLITAYKPDPDKWSNDFKTRKERK